MRRAVSAFRAWLLQRLSAVVMLAYLLFVLAHFWLDPPNSYQQWTQWLHQPAIAIVTGVFFAALLLHAWVGLRDVLMDYVHPLAIRLGLLTLLGLALLALGLWAMRILLQVSG
jgi:succinate dehydrogenase / fumarate reductase membrane anchor subunit